MVAGRVGNSLVAGAAATELIVETVYFAVSHLVLWVKSQLEEISISAIILVRALSFSQKFFGFEFDSINVQG